MIIDIILLAPSLHILLSAFEPFNHADDNSISLTVSILIESFAYAKGLYLKDSHRFFGASTFILKPFK